ncbi:class I SAM-dependent methyltransferase [Nocardia sp. NPDC051052]|uniref:class I SAM-dependent methyltransferase n=1 Tax=Nocardia sp. NPDC051052 TaxID=3364322 RepID=UPI0037BA03F5
MSNVTDVFAGESYGRNAAFWTKIIRERLDRYRTELTDRTVMAAVGDCTSQRILDAGCGEGYLSRIIQSGGGQVVGIDACAELIEAARSTAEHEERDIVYHHGSVNALPLEDETFDCVVCNHLVNDLPDPAPAFSEFGRVLKPGGKLVVLMLHPCFYPAPTGVETASEESVSDQYFEVRSFAQNFRVAGESSPAPVTVWMRPLESYLSSLTDANFSLAVMQEPRPTPEQIAADPWWRENFRRPTFLLLVAERKPSR